MIGALIWPPRSQDASALLGSCIALQTTRLRRLLTAFLGAGSVALLALISVQVALNYPAVRYVALSVAALTLMTSLALVRHDRVRAATAVLTWGVATAVSAQSLVAGGLHNPGLFAYPALLAVTGAMLGMRQARVMLVAMLAVIAVLAGPVALGSGEPWGWQPVEPSPPGMRALVLGVFLLLMHAGLRVFTRSHLRDVQAIESLNRGLHETVTRLREREAELMRAQQQVEALNQVLDRRVSERTAELGKALQRLEALQLELERVQPSAVAGTLAAGLAGELSAPVGTALVCSSTVEASAHDLLALLRGPGSLRRADLVTLAQRVLDNAELSQRALQRAAVSAEAFKGVAQDQSLRLRRRFDLAQNVARLATTLRPILAPKGLLLELDLQAGIEMDGWPGALDQVLIALVRHASERAFAPGDGGTIRLSARRLGAGQVELLCCDNGRGLAPEALRQLLDPLHAPWPNLTAAAALVQRELQGSLQASSRPGEGSCLSLQLPLQA